MSFWCRTAGRYRGGGLQLFCLCFIYIRHAVFLPDSHRLDTVTSSEAWLLSTNTDMSIIYSAEACSINTGRAILINYQSLHYAFDNRVKFSAEKFHRAGGQLIQFEAREKGAKQKTQGSIRGEMREIDLCHSFHDIFPVWSFGRCEKVKFRRCTFNTRPGRTNKCLCIHTDSH